MPRVLLQEFSRASEDSQSGFIFFFLVRFFAAYNCASCNVYKMRLNVLDPISHKNSAFFVNEIGHMTDGENLFLASFYIKESYINIFLKETIDICLDIYIFIHI